MIKAVAALIVAMPLVAHAQSGRIPNGELRGYFNRCVQVCDDTRSYGFCADKCGCMTNEISRAWDMDRYNERVGRLRANAQDGDVHAQMDRLAQSCASRSMR